MQEYSLKRGNKPDLERIHECLAEIFPAEIKKNGDKLVISYGIFKTLTVWIQNKKLVVETESDTTVINDEVILDTNKRYRDFLYKATGYTAKERLKKAKEDVSK
ncbi:DUF5611 family protein [uncultured Methanomethylovorans sp.]|uniref:DUF5611 family protein n=1 Tax=uncultured Methanomethylovorans sp. TaxID=183759 RepID=UPI002AA6876C|nr:DUF5611 family protein [uncultured Methanomethylovorans sp.]